MAEDLGNRLLPAFDSPTGMPYMFVNLKTGKTSGAETNPAEIGTLILEFGTLSKLTGKPVFYDKAKKALVELYRRRGKTGLVGQGINVETGEWTSRRSHVGGAIDSYYEYLLKCEKLFGDSECGDMWRVSIAALNTHVAHDTPNGLWYGVVDMDTGARVATTYGSLHAFLPGYLRWAAIWTARSGCRTPGSGCGRFTASSRKDSTTSGCSRHGPAISCVRKSSSPRTTCRISPRIRATSRWERRCSRISKKHTRTEAGYTVLESVVTKEKGDLMHSFFLAETLKYAYLIFAPQALDFDKVVFNTEAHPLRRTW